MTLQLVPKNIIEFRKMPLSCFWLMIDGNWHHCRDSEFYNKNTQVILILRMISLMWIKISQVLLLSQESGNEGRFDCYFPL